VAAAKTQQQQKAQPNPTKDPAERLASAEAKVAALQGEVERLQKALAEKAKRGEELEKQLADANERVRSARKTTIDGLGEDDRQLGEPVTIADANGDSVSAKAGDVLTIDGDRVPAIQKLLGGKGRVYHVTDETVLEVEQMGFLCG